MADHLAKSQKQPDWFTEWLSNMDPREASASKNLKCNREAFKYYLADFFRYGGTPLPPENTFAKKNLAEMGGTRPP